MNDITTNDNEEQKQQHDNSATIPRSNISSPQHSAKPNQQQGALSQNTNNTNNNNNNSSNKIEGKASSPAVVELSSLFQTESTLFRDESQHSSGKCRNCYFVICKYCAFAILHVCCVVYDLQTSN